MEHLTKRQAVCTYREAIQDQNELQLRDEYAQNDNSVHGVFIFFFKQKTAYEVHR